MQEKREIIVAIMQLKHYANFVGLPCNLAETWRHADYAKINGNKQ